MKTNYYPKGGRCAACTKQNDDCSTLPFNTMPVHRRDGCDVVVICNQFRQLNHSTSLQGERWADGLSWEDLMALKRQCGRGDRDALEVYPADKDVVNVANMRHLWLPAEPVAFAWRKK